MEVSQHRAGVARGGAYSSARERSEQSRGTGGVLTIRPPGTPVVAGVVTAIVLALVIMGSIATFLVYQGWVFFGDEQFERLFYLDRELGVPATVSVLGLVACSLVLAVLAAARHQGGGYGFGRHWTVLAVGFAYLAIDGGAAVHEVMTAALNGLPVIDQYSFLDRAWVIAGGFASIVVGIAYIPFLRHLPRPYAIGMAVAGAMYVGGAVGFEMLSATAHADLASIRYLIFMVTEETLEMAGIGLFFILLWSLASRTPWRIESPATGESHRTD